MKQPAERRDDGSGSGDVYEGFFGTNVFRTEIESDKFQTTFEGRLKMITVIAERNRG